MPDTIIEQAHALLPAVCELSRKAGEEILRIYDSDFAIEHKDDRSPLTEADMAAHHTIVDGLGALAPVFPVLSEESAAMPFAERQQRQTYWLVDPLDGTREFIKRNGEFTVNIALIHEHRPILGVVYAPVLDTLWYASQDHGAWKQEKGQTQAQPIHVRPFAKDKPVVAGSRSHRGDSLLGFLERLGDHELIGMGSSIKMCLVAEGVADVYPRFGPTSEWDTGAAQCVVEEAGGRITDKALQALRYNTKDSLLNPDFLAFGDSDHDWTALLQA